MYSWPYDVGDVLLVNYKGVEQPARVSGYTDSLDDTTPLYVNLRVADGLRWGTATRKIGKEQIIRALPTWQQDRDAAYEETLREWAEKQYAQMSLARKEELHQWAIKRRRRSPLDRLIDQACGLD